MSQSLLLYLCIDFCSKESIDKSLLLIEFTTIEYTYILDIEDNLMMNIRIKVFRIEVKPIL